MVGIGRLGGAAEPRGAADHRLVELLPEGSGPHESLVVEAGGEDRPEQLIHGENVELERGPAILARGVEPVVKLDGGGAGVGLAPRARAKLDQSIRLFRACGEDAARAVVFERAADETNAVGKQRRGERVAGMAAELSAVEIKAQGPRPVDQAAVCEPVRLMRGRHFEVSFAADSTATISCVLILRVTTSQEWQPAL